MKICLPSLHYWWWFDIISIWNVFVNIVKKVLLQKLGTDQLSIVLLCATANQQGSKKVTRVLLVLKRVGLKRVKDYHQVQNLRNEQGDGMLADTLDYICQTTQMLQRTEVC